MLILSLIWLLLGGMIGLLANAAQLQLTVWRRGNWPLLIGVGMMMAQCGGWLGVFLLGRFFSTSMALWIACVGVIVLPWIINRNLQHS